MGLTRFSGSGFKKNGSEIVVVYHSTPFPCLGRRIFCLEKIVIYNDVGGDHHGGADGRGDGQCPACRHRSGGHLHWCRLQCLSLLLPGVEAAQRLYACCHGRCRRCCWPHGCRPAVVCGDGRTSSQPWGCCTGCLWFWQRRSSGGW